MTQEDKAKAIAMRDRLNEMVEEIMSRRLLDMEDHVVACCLAVAIEELEKWIYTNDWTPSVRPYVDDREFTIPYPTGSEDDPNQSGPPWNRKKANVLDRFPTVKRLKEQGKLAGQRTPVRLDDLEEHHWTNPVRTAFRNGDRTMFKRLLRVALGYPVAVKDLTEYLDRQIALNPVLWGLDEKPEDKCPKCGKDHIDHSQSASAWPNVCCECGMQWGVILPF